MLLSLCSGSLVEICSVQAQVPGKVTAQVKRSLCPLPGGAVQDGPEFGLPILILADVLEIAGDSVVGAEQRTFGGCLLLRGCAHRIFVNLVHHISIDRGQFISTAFQQILQGFLVGHHGHLNEVPELMVCDAHFGPLIKNAAEFRREPVRHTHELMRFGQPFLRARRMPYLDGVSMVTKRGIERIVTHDAHRGESGGNAAVTVVRGGEIVDLLYCSLIRLTFALFPTTYCTSINF
jgi:hypothetical protein